MLDQIVFTKKYNNFRQLLTNFFDFFAEKFNTMYLKLKKLKLSMYLKLKLDMYLKLLIKGLFQLLNYSQIQTVLFIAFLMTTKIGDPKSQRVKNENPRKSPRDPPNSDTKDSKSYI